MRCIDAEVTPQETSARLPAPDTRYNRVTALQPPRPDSATGIETECHFRTSVANLTENLKHGARKWELSMQKADARKQGVRMYQTL